MLKFSGCAFKRQQLPENPIKKIAQKIKPVVGFMSMIVVGFMVVNGETATNEVGEGGCM